MKKIIAVTGCPTGIAHTFMAEEALKTAAKKLNVEIKVETNGASGVENAITPEDLKDIYGVIIAADKDVNAERFNGLPVIEVPVKEAIHHPAELINKVVNGQAQRRQGLSATTDPAEKYERESFGRQIYKHLMSGVSNMLPFVVAGGILIAVSFLWGIYSADPNSPQYNVIAATLMKVGQQAFSIMVPVFTAYIAWSISGRPGMVAGFVGGLLANATGAGFLGGIIAGFAAGYFMLLIRHLLDGLPRQYEGLKSIFIMPLIGVLVIGVMMVLLGQPVAAINNGMMNWLSSLQEANPILLGIVVGAMCSFDFGGPVNKAAYVTGTLLLGQGNYFFMAGVSAACITPPLVIALLKENGYLELLRDLLIHQVFCDLKILQDQGYQHFILSLNLTAEQLVNPKLISKIQQEIDQTGINSSMIGLELTEQAAMEITQKNIAQIMRLRKLGVRIIMDDFGMGHSSMMYLLNNQFDCVKLDGSLIKQLRDSKRSAKIIESIMQLSQSLHFDVVAEYVEDQSQQQQLADMGCHIYQGWLYSKALSFTDLQAYLHEHNAEP